jgi:hypothetical protein
VTAAGSFPALTLGSALGHGIVDGAGDHRVDRKTRERVTLPSRPRPRDARHAAFYELHRSRGRGVLKAVRRLLEGCKKAF